MASNVSTYHSLQRECTHAATCTDVLTDSSNATISWYIGTSDIGVVGGSGAAATV